MADLIKDESGILIDGDTELDSSGNRQRYAGVNAREEAKVEEDKYGNEYFNYTQVGAIEQTRAMEQLIEEGKFIYKERTGEYDDFGREIIERYNEKGDKLSEVAIASGVLSPSRYTDPSAMDALRAAELSRELGLTGTDYDPLGEAVQESLYQYGIGFKTDALNEREYDPALHSGVMFRDHDRTLTNEAKGFTGQIGEAWGQGWNGVKEGFYGYLDAIGETTGIEMLENIGDAGVLRARQRMREAPEIILDYQEVDSIGKGFQYLLNNAAMSAPYMVTTFGALAAAVPVGAAATLLTGNPIVGAAAGSATAILPTSFIYAGQTWNEMEGDRGVGQFVAASVAGVTIGSLDRLGLRGVIAPSVNLYSKEGVNAVAKKLVERNTLERAAGSQVAELSIEEARRKVINSTLKEQANYLKILSSTENAKDIITKYGKAFNKKDIALHGLQGAIRESGTEIAQELVQYGVATGVSDKEADSDELLNRIINAGIAGGTLGGGLSIAGNTYEQGKAALFKTGFQKADAERYSVVNKARIDEIERSGRVNSVEENHKQLRTEIATAQATGTYDVNESSVIAKLAKEFIPESITNTIAASKKLSNMVINSTKDVLRTAVVNSKYDNVQLQEIADGKNVVKAEQSLALDKDILESAKNDPTQNKKSIQGFEEAVKKSEKALERAKEKQLSARKEIERRNQGGVQLNEDETTALAAYLNELNKPQEEREKTAPKAETFRGNKLAKAAKDYDTNTKGIPNFFRNNKDLYDYFTSTVTGIKKLYQALEAQLGDIKSIMSDPYGRMALAMFSQYTTGSFHHGKGFRQYQESLLADLTQYVDEHKIAKLFGFKKATVKNIQAISKAIRTFLFNTETEVSTFNLFDKHVKEGKRPEEWVNNNYTYNEARRLFIASSLIKKQSEEALIKIDKVYEEETGIPNYFSSQMSRDWWYSNQAFNYREVRRNKEDFIKWVMSSEEEFAIPMDRSEAEILWQNIAYRGQATFLENFSLVDGNYTFYPSFAEQKLQNLQKHKGFDRWANENMFEHLNIIANEASKYSTLTTYFGHAGNKLDFIISKMKENANNPASGSTMTPEDVDRFAYYYKAGIDSNYGNFNPIRNPVWAAINRFLVSWSVYAGLTLSSISSIPETAMVYYALMDDDEWKAASANIVKEFGNTFKEALTNEITQTTKLLNQSGQPITVSSIADRFATGERDISHAEWQEWFFTVSLIKHVTHFQRKAAAATAIDTMTFRTNILIDAPIKQTKAGLSNPNVEFDFDKFNNYEMEAYTMLADLGLDVEGLVTTLMNFDILSRNSMFNVTDNSYRDDKEHFAPMSPKQTAIIDALKQKNPTSDDQEIINQAKEMELFLKEQVETAVYRFVIERVQNPQATNRPLFFQDPRYQLLTQFNGFISTFTAVVVPKLWKRYLLKGQPQVKYNTFALIVTMIALGGASQYLKDLIKFGFDDADNLGASPFMNDKSNATASYIQRALYSSGVLGQGERVVDALYPLYPDRDDWLFSLLVGEAGPTARNVSNLVTGTGQIISAEDQKDATRGLSNIFKTVPGIAGSNDIRTTAAQATTDIFSAQNPVEDLFN